MTRINANINVRQLTDKHLLAEHREIKRVPARFKGRLDKGDFSGIPEAYKLGSGHELFFINKGKFTLERYKALHTECIERGFNVTDFTSSWDVYNGNEKFFCDWEATEEDNALVKERIVQRLTEAKSKLKYFGDDICIDNAIFLLR